MIFWDPQDNYPQRAIVYLEDGERVIFVNKRDAFEEGALFWYDDDITRAAIEYLNALEKP